MQEMRLQLCELTIAMLSPLYALKPTHLHGNSVLKRTLHVQAPVAIRMLQTQLAPFIIDYLINNLVISHTIIYK